MPRKTKYEPVTPSRFLELLAGQPLKSIDELALLEVDWLDSASRDCWTDIEWTRRRDDMPGGMKCRTVGYLIAEDDETITLAGSVCVNLDAACSMQILKRCITAHRVIPNPRDNKRKRQSK